MTCDRCGPLVLARWEILVNGLRGGLRLKLYFCNHHYERYKWDFFIHGYACRFLPEG